MQVELKKEADLIWLEVFEKNRDGLGLFDTFYLLAKKTNRVVAELNDASLGELADLLKQDSVASRYLWNKLDPATQKKLDRLVPYRAAPPPEQTPVYRSHQTSLLPKDRKFLLSELGLLFHVKGREACETTLAGGKILFVRHENHYQLVDHPHLKLVRFSDSEMRLGTTSVQEQNECFADVFSSENDEIFSPDCRSFSAHFITHSGCHANMIVSAFEASQHSLISVHNFMEFFCDLKKLFALREMRDLGLKKSLSFLPLAYNVPVLTDKDNWWRIVSNTSQPLSQADPDKAAKQIARFFYYESLLRLPIMGDPKSAERAFVWDSGKVVCTNKMVCPRFFGKEELEYMRTRDFLKALPEPVQKKVEALCKEQQEGLLHWERQLMWVKLLCKQDQPVDYNKMWLLSQMTEIADRGVTFDTLSHAMKWVLSPISNPKISNFEASTDTHLEAKKHLKFLLLNQLFFSSTSTLTFEELCKQAVDLLAKLAEQLDPTSKEHLYLAFGDEFLEDLEKAANEYSPEQKKIDAILFYRAFHNTHAMFKEVFLASHPVV